MSDNLNPVRPGQTGADHPASKPLSDHRSKVIAIRVTAKERSTISRKAKKAGLSINKFCRREINLPP